MKHIKSQDEKKLIKNQNICSTETSIGYILFIFKCNLINRYKTGFCRIDAFEQTKETLLKIDTDGEMIYSVKIFNPYYEKLMVFLLKKNGFTQINSNTFDGLVDDFKIIIEIVTLLESLFNKDLFFTRDFLKAECHNITNKEILEENEPVIKKAKRSIDKVDPATLQIIETYESLAQAGKNMNVTGNAIGIAVRNSTKCQGYLWKYHGEINTRSEKKVVKINCNTSEQVIFNSLADAGKDIVM